MKSVQYALRIPPDIKQTVKGLVEGDRHFRGSMNQFFVEAIEGAVVARLGEAWRGGSRGGGSPRGPDAAGGPPPPVPPPGEERGVRLEEYQGEPLHLVNGSLVDSEGRRVRWVHPPQGEEEDFSAYVDRCMTNSSGSSFVRAMPITPEEIEACARTKERIEQALAERDAQESAAASTGVTEMPAPPPPPTGTPRTAWDKAVDG